MVSRHEAPIKRLKRKISDLQGTVQKLTTTVDELMAAHVKRQKSCRI